MSNDNYPIMIFLPINGISKFMKNNKFGFIDAKTGKVICEPIYDDLNIFNNGFSIVTIKKIKTSWVVINGIQEAIWVRCNGIINKKGEEILEPIYDNIYYAKDNLFIVELNYKFGVFDNTGKIILPIEYSHDYILDNWKMVIRRLKLREIV